MNMRFCFSLKKRKQAGSNESEIPSFEKEKKMEKSKFTYDSPELTLTFVGEEDIIRVSRVDYDPAGGGNIQEWGYPTERRKVGVTV